jgi:hypothetical protein
MQQFTVPQFIDVESKIIGPVTTRQFLIFLGAAVIIALSYRLFDFSMFLLIAIIIGIIAVVFAFVKINGRPFHFFVLNLVQTIGRPHTRVWHKIDSGNPIEAPMPPIDSKVKGQSTKEHFRQSKLAELSLIVDTKGRYRGDIDDDNQDK